MDSPTTSKIPHKESVEDEKTIWKDITVDREIREPVAEKEEEVAAEVEGAAVGEGVAEEEEDQEDEDEEDQEEEDQEEEDHEEEVIVISSDDEDRDMHERFPSRAVLEERRRIFRAQRQWTVYQSLKHRRRW